MHDLTDLPRANRNPDELDRRRAALWQPHMRPLASYVANLRNRYPGVEFPDFDPLGGGVTAEILMLFEKPGPKTSLEGGGSGFISVNNDDATAEATWHFLRRAEIPISQLASWNVIPGWDGAIRHRAKDVSEGIAHLPELFSLLAKLETVILVGRKAAQAEQVVRDGGYRVILSDHPSPKVRAIYPDRWARIPNVWAQALT